MKRVLILGAHSYIGSFFQGYVSRCKGGWQASALSLRGEEWKNVPFSGYDAIVHAVGIAHADGGIPKGIYYRINTDLAVEAAKKAKREGVGQFIYLSSAKVYGDSAPIGGEKIITTDTPPAPQTYYGDSKLQAESWLRPMASKDFSVANLRLPMVYGPGSRGNYPRLAKLAVRTPLFPWVENRRSMLYIENLCEFLWLMIENRESGTFHPQNREYVCTSVMVKTIAAAHEHKIWMVSGAEALLKAAGRFSGTVNKVFGNFIYEQSLSRYPQNYQMCSFERSIARTEER